MRIKYVGQSNPAIIDLVDKLFAGSHPQQSDIETIIITPIFSNAHIDRVDPAQTDHQLLLPVPPSRGSDEVVYANHFDPPTMADQWILQQLSTMYRTVHIALPEPRVFSREYQHRMVGLIATPNSEVHETNNPKDLAIKNGYDLTHALLCPSQKGQIEIAPKIPELYFSPAHRIKGAAPPLVKLYMDTGRIKEIRHAIPEAVYALISR